MSNTVRMMDPEPASATPTVTVLRPSHSWPCDTHGLCELPFYDVTGQPCRSREPGECCYCGGTIGSR